MTDIKELKSEYYFDLNNLPYLGLFNQTKYVWEILPLIKKYIQENFKAPKTLQKLPGVTFKGKLIIIGEGTVIEQGAYIAAPAIIGRNCTIRQGAYLRGNVLVGNNVIIGHATEVKNSVFFNGAKAPHFNYVGDSILGYAVNLGAGTKLSNVKIFDAPVSVHFNDKVLLTGLRKFGAILGDKVQTGCNSVLNPGALLGPGSMVYPNVTVSGWNAKGSILKPASPPRKINSHLSK